LSENRHTDRREESTLEGPMNMLTKLALGLNHDQQVLLSQTVGWPKP
jgi:hypothetical protein